MTQNIEQRTLAAVNQYENASGTIDKFAHADEVLTIPTGAVKTFPKISKEWDENSKALTADWKAERDALSIKALPVLAWVQGETETNINQQRRFTDGHTYLPKTVPALMNAEPDANWIAYTADKSDVLSDVFGSKPVDLVNGLVITPVNNQYPKLAAFGAIYELADNSATYTVKSFAQSVGGDCVITLSDDTPLVAKKVDAASREFVQNLIAKITNLTVASFMQNPYEVGVGETLTVSGYHRKGIGESRWERASGVFNSSQSPLQLGELAFTDKNGRKYKLVHDSVISIEQIGAQEYIPLQNNKKEVDIAYLTLMLSKLQGRGKARLIVNFDRGSYYSSRGILLNSRLVFNAGVSYPINLFIGTNKWTEEEVPHVKMSGVTTWYSLKTFQVGVIHETDRFTEFSGIDGFYVITENGGKTDFGLYAPYVTSTVFSNSRFTGNDIGLSYKDIYSCKFDRVIFTASADASFAGSFAIHATPRNDKAGCGTSQIWERCGFVDYVLGVQVSKLSYSTFTSCYTEGVLSQRMFYFIDCGITINQWGCERLTSTELNRPLMWLTGGSIVINGANPSYGVNAGGNTVLKVDGKGTCVVNGLDMTLLKNGSEAALIETADVSQVVINPVIKPTDKTYNYKLGLSTFMFGKDFLMAGRYNGGRLILGNNPTGVNTPQYIYNDGGVNHGGYKILRVSNGRAPTDPTNGDPLNGNSVLLEANFRDASHSINTHSKYLGKSAYDRTYMKVLYAGGGAAIDPWRDAMGNVVYTPV